MFLKNLVYPNLLSKIWVVTSKLPKINKQQTNICIQKCSIFLNFLVTVITSQ